MKILLLQPPIQDFYDTDVRLQPIGLGYLKASILRHHPDVEVKIVDLHQGHGRFPVRVPEELAYLKEYYPYPDKSPFRTFYHYYHFGADFAAVESVIRSENPDVIGISSLFTPYFREALAVAKIAKRCFPDRPVVLGGSHVSACPDEVLAHDEVDFVVAGEGERPMVELVSHFKGELALERVSRLGFKRAGRPTFNAGNENYPLDEIPFPCFADLDPGHYQYAGKKMTFMITSRSCPHRCSFCSVHQTFGQRFRRRSHENILAEIRLRHRQGYRIIDFEDDNLTFFREEMKALCRALIAEFPPGELEFVAMNGISYLSLDDELLELMRAAGFTHLNLALVSSDRLVREATKRPHTVERFLSVVAKGKELSLKIVSYQILGLPMESLESMIQTLCFGARLPVLLGASLFYLTPNSPIAARFPERSESDRFLARLTSMHIETPEVKRGDLYTLFITTRIINFVKSFAVDRELPLSDLLAAAVGDGHGVAGLDLPKIRGLNLLRRLLEERILFADLGGETRKPLLRFDYALFARVWNQLEFIAPTDGPKIWLTGDRDKLKTYEKQKQEGSPNEHPERKTADHFA